MKFREKYKDALKDMKFEPMHPKEEMLTLEPFYLLDYLGDLERERAAGIITEEEHQIRRNYVLDGLYADKTVDDMPLRKYYEKILKNLEKK